MGSKGNSSEKRRVKLQRNDRYPPGPSNKYGDEIFDKHSVLNLRTRLDKFIIEEKERTMMHQSDIPDPNESHLPKIEEINNSSTNDEYSKVYKKYHQFQQSA